MCGCGVDSSKRSADEAAKLEHVAQSLKQELVTAKAKLTAAEQDIARQSRVVQRNKEELRCVQCHMRLLRGLRVVGSLSVAGWL